MNWIAIVLAALAALLCYLASRHQALLPAARGHGRKLCAGAGVAGAGAVLLAGMAYGAWCGFFIALSGYMLVLVALPYADAWRRSRHVA